MENYIPPELSEIDKAFETGDIHNKSIIELEQYLIHLSKTITLHDGLQTKIKIQATTINNLILLKTIKHIDNRQSLLTYCTIGLAIVSAVASVFSILSTVGLFHVSPKELSIQIAPLKIDIKQDIEEKLLHTQKIPLYDQSNVQVQYSSNTPNKRLHTGSAVPHR